MADSATRSPVTDASEATRPAPRTWLLIGLAVAVALIAIAILVPRVFLIVVYASQFPPLDAYWNPRFGPGTVPAVVLALLAALQAPRLATTLSWHALLAACYAAGVGWLVALATVDGWVGISLQLGRSSEYLPTARSVTSVSTLLHDFIARIPLHSAHNWPIHVAGHPPLALLFFVLLVHLGLGGSLAAGWVVLLIGATTPLAVLVTLRALGAEADARRVAPLLVFGPAAIWIAVSADAMFAAVAAWGLCALAVAAVIGTARARIAMALLAGVLLGCCLFLSYGLAVLAVLAVAVLLAARTVRPLPWAALGAAAVVIAFAVSGFSWWRAYPVLHDRYWAGFASLRPDGYWTWGDIAALCMSAGPVLGLSLAAVAHRVWSQRRLDAPVVALVLGASVCIAIADASLMSKAEVERIWLPFVPWLLLGCALLPATWRRRALAGQVVFALVVQSLLTTHW